jgi:hypothetical protein
LPARSAYAQALQAGRDLNLNNTQKIPASAGMTKKTRHCEDPDPPTGGEGNEAISKKQYKKLLSLSQRER